MGKVELVRDGEVSIDACMGELEVGRGCGAVVCFIGVVREEGLDGGKVEELYYEADDGNTLMALERVREEIIKDEGVFDLVIHHSVGRLRPGQRTLCIAVSSGHSEEALSALKRALKGVKTGIPMWKKEVTDKGSYWVSGGRRIGRS